MTTLRNTPSFNNHILGSTPISSPSKYPQQSLDALPVLPSSPPNRPTNTHTPNSIMSPLNRSSNSTPHITTETPLPGQRSLQPSPLRSPSPARPRRARKRKRSSLPLNDHTIPPPTTPESRKCNEVLEFIKSKNLSVPSFLDLYIRLDHSTGKDSDTTRSQKSAATRRRIGIARVLRDVEIQDLLHTAEEDLLISSRTTATPDPSVYAAELNKLKEAKAFRKWSIDEDDEKVADFEKYDIEQDMIEIEEMAPHWIALLRILSLPERANWKSYDGRKDGEDKSTRRLIYFVTSMLMHKRSPKQGVYALIQFGLWLESQGTTDRAMSSLQKFGLCPNIKTIHRRVGLLQSYAKVRDSSI
jgi:hypothetical protein